MAFELSRFVKQTLAFNAGQISTTNNPSATVVLSNGPAFYSYASATDTVAVISAANYFSEVAYQLEINDVIMVVGSDASVFLQVSAVDTSVVPATIAVVSFTAAAAVNTANIADGAVTAVKLASDSVITAKILDANVTTAKLANNAVTSAKLALNTLQYAAVTVSSAEFLGAFATPKQLVAAQGANTLIVLDRVELLMTFNSIAYAGGGVTHIQYANTASGGGVIASTTLAAATFFATVSTGFNFNAGVVAQTFSTCVNQGLFLSNITGAFTSGNSAMVAHVWYKVIPSI